jgi:hypothetical protein
MKTAMVVTWTEPIPGREMKAIEYGADVTTFWTKQAEAGKCSMPDMLFSERGSGMWIVMGERDTLLALHDTAEAQTLITRGQLLMNGFCVDFFTVGDASDAFLARYASLAGSLL